MYAMLLWRFANEKSAVYLNNEIIRSDTSGYRLIGTMYTVSISVLLTLAFLNLFFTVS